MPWWLWVLMGLGLMLLEILTPGGFFVILFGVAAVVVGVLVGLELAGPAWLQWLLFSFLSIVSLLLFRKRLLAKFQFQQPGADKVDTLVGEVVILLDDIPPGEVGKAELRGTAWNTHNDSEQLLRRGQRCRVQRIAGLTLWVRAL